MNRLAWLTDIHLNFLQGSAFYALVDQLAEAPADAFLIGGDIAEAGTLAVYLSELVDAVRRPVYFVLGNHDYYGSSIASVRRRLAQLAQSEENLFWLPDAGVVRLDRRTALVGSDGWADGRCGNYERSEVLLNDYLQIEELSGLDKRRRLGVLQRLGDESARQLKAVLDQALPDYERVLVLTHVPPFRQACWHEGQICDDDWLPHMVCWATGQVMRQTMMHHPDRQALVLCGHTHSGGQSQILPNLRVLTGAAIYGQPQVQCILDLTRDEWGRIAG